VLKRLEQSKEWQYFVIGIIVLNTVALALEADNPTPAYWGVIDNLFLSIFCAELALRLAVYRCSFFCNQDQGWNLFDFTVVSAGVLDQWILDVVLEGGGSQMSTVVALLRILRLLRVLRAVRLFGQLRQLRLLISGLVGSVSSVIWIAVLFFILIFTSAIFVTNMVGTEADSFEDPAAIRGWFGSMGRSMATLSIFLTCDDWSTPARMVNKQYPWMEAFWIWYIVMGAFLILSLLTGLMADKMKEARDADNTAREQADPDELARLLDTFKGDENLTCKEFQEMVSQPEISEALAKCGLQKLGDSEQKLLFKLFDRDGSGTISWSELHDAFVQISKHACPVASPLEIMKLEGIVTRLDRTLREASRGGAMQVNGGPEPWDRRLDLVHARSEVLVARLHSLEKDVNEFFEAMGYNHDKHCRSDDDSTE